MSGTFCALASVLGQFLPNLHSSFLLTDASLKRTQRLCSQPDRFCAGTKSIPGRHSVTERSCAAWISKVESHISDSRSYYAGQVFMSARKTVRYTVNIALG